MHKRSAINGALLRRQSIKPKEAHRTMALNQSRRLSPSDLDSDRAAVIATQSIPNYKPLNPAYSAATLVDLNAARDKAQHDEIHAQQVLAAARDAAAAA